MTANNSQSARLNFDYRFDSCSASATTARFLNQKSNNKRCSIEEGLNSLFYPEAMLVKSDPLTKQQAYDILKAIQYLESKLSLYRQVYSSLVLPQAVLEFTSIHQDRVPESVTKTFVEIQSEFQSIEVPVGNQVNDDDDELDFGNSGL